MADIEAKAEEVKRMDVMEALLESLCGEKVQITFRTDWALHGATVAGKLSKHLSGAWRVSMPAGKGEDQQGNTRNYPPQDSHFPTESVAMVLTQPRVDVIGLA